jgi:hypothetical protein
MRPLQGDGVAAQRQGRRRSVKSAAKAAPSPQTRVTGSICVLDAERPGPVGAHRTDDHGGGGPEAKAASTWSVSPASSAIVKKLVTRAPR